MADVVVLTAIWMIAVLQLALQAGVILYAYRLTRLTGSFRAWTMLIGAFTLTTMSSLFGLFFLITNPDLIAGILQQLSIPTVILSYSISIATSLLYFFGVFDLVRRFKQTAKNPHP